MGISIQGLPNIGEHVTTDKGMVGQIVGLDTSEFNCGDIFCSVAFPNVIEWFNVTDLTRGIVSS